MRFLFSKQSVIVLIVLILIGAGVFAYVETRKYAVPPVEEPVIPQNADPKTEVIGTSVENRPITAYTYGEGKTNLLFVGGMHGGYEWNAVLLAYQFMDYLHTHPGLIPDTLSVTVVPELNIDGVYKVTGKVGPFSIADVSTSTAVDQAGRFNADKVDLNRNFDCNWKPTSTWQNKTVSAGTAPFSEPESQALRKIVLEKNPNAVVFWHSQANAVYASECNNGVLPATLAVMNAYAGAAGYPAVKAFTAYAVTGDSEGWLASIHIPAITVELQTHETIEWERNLSGIKALINLYTPKQQ